jgi:hypothetical protein
MRSPKAAYHALLLSLAAGVTACGGAGPADADADGRIDTVDHCPETPAGTRVGPDGCGATDDGDRDGLRSGDDVCAGTAHGAGVDAFGCSKRSGSKASGRARLSGKRCGRPPAVVDVERALQLRSQGLSLRKAAKKLGVSTSVLHRALKAVPEVPPDRAA